jgi:hypothetical protein
MMAGLSAIGACHLERVQGLLGLQLVAVDPSIHSTMWISAFSSNSSAI